MRLFVLKADRNVEVVDIASKVTAYMAECCPVGQIFMQGLFSWQPEAWYCLHRADNQWRAASKVPSEVLMTALIVG